MGYPNLAVTIVRLTLTALGTSNTMADNLSAIRPLNMVSKYQLWCLVTSDGQDNHALLFSAWDLAGSERSLPWAKGGSHQRHAYTYMVHMAEVCMSPVSLTSAMPSHQCQAVFPTENALKLCRSALHDSYHVGRQWLLAKLMELENLPLRQSASGTCTYPVIWLI